MSGPRTSMDAAALCGLPVVRRIYCGLVVGLAVFFVSLVALREPFRGYLGEVRVAGPVPQGLDLEAGAAWLRQSEPRAAIVVTAPDEMRPRGQLRMTLLSLRPEPALERLKELSTQWLGHFLPAQIQEYRRGELAELKAAASIARDQEDQARQTVEGLRQEQLAHMLRMANQAAIAAAAPAAPPEELTAVLPEAESPEKRLHEKLLALRGELAQALANCTEDHPQVISLRKKIAGVEAEMELLPEQSPPPATGPDLLPELPAKVSRALNEGDSRGAGNRSIALTANSPAPTSGEESGGGDAGRLPDALQVLAQASRARQLAEENLNERLQSLANEPAAADWSADPPRVVARIGGTPQPLTLALGSVLGMMAGGIMFWYSAALVIPRKLHTAADVEACMGLPVMAGSSGGAIIQPALPSQHAVERTRAVVLVAEVIVAVAAGACVLSVAMEPALAAQVLADPFGALSEVIGRWSAHEAALSASVGLAVTAGV